MCGTDGKLELFDQLIWDLGNRLVDQGNSVAVKHAVDWIVKTLFHRPIPTFSPKYLSIYALKLVIDFGSRLTALMWDMAEFVLQTFNVKSRITRGLSELVDGKYFYASRLSQGHVLQLHRVGLLIDFLSDSIATTSFDRLAIMMPNNIRLRIASDCTRECGCLGLFHLIENKQRE